MDLVSLFLHYSIHPQIFSELLVGHWYKGAGQRKSSGEAGSVVTVIRPGSGVVLEENLLFGLVGNRGQVLMKETTHPHPAQEGVPVS